MAQTKHVDLGKYNYNAGFINYPFDDEQSLPKVIKQYNAISLAANASHENVFYAWGTILKVAIMHRLTDMLRSYPLRICRNRSAKTLSDTGVYLPEND